MMVKYLIVLIVIVGMLLSALKNRYVRKNNVRGVSFCDGGLIVLVSSSPMLFLIEG